MTSASISWFICTRSWRWSDRHGCLPVVSKRRDLRCRSCGGGLRLTTEVSFNLFHCLPGLQRCSARNIKDSRLETFRMHRASADSVVNGNDSFKGPANIQRSLPRRLDKHTTIDFNYHTPRRQVVHILLHRPSWHVGPSNSIGASMARGDGAAHSNLTSTSPSPFAQSSSEQPQAPPFPTLQANREESTWHTLSSFEARLLLLQVHDATLLNPLRAVPSVKTDWQVAGSRHVESPGTVHFPLGAGSMRSAKPFDGLEIDLQGIAAGAGDGSVGWRNIVLVSSCFLCLYTEYTTVPPPTTDTMVRTTPLLFAATALGSALPQKPDDPDATKHCKCFPGEKCWPSQEEWSSLNDTVDGRLIATVPLASPCYQSWGNHDEDTCNTLQDLWTKPGTHIDTSSSVMAPFFANQSTSIPSGNDIQC